ncbi:MAG: phage tail tape measure protein, partial [Clostridia bacterium]|nr:phage tail tape measure protein [Clostridia bacterium]
ETLVETEDKVIAIKRVINESIGNQQIADQLYDIAIAYGQTFENVSDIAINFARTGMSWADTLEATKAAVIALNVAELDATQATDGLIAVMTQFGLNASDLMSIIDQLNKVADNFPVTTEKMLTALQRTGSSASNANLSLEQTLGIITAISKATGRSGANIGTAVNSLIQYSQKSGALDVFAQLSDNTNAVVDRYRMGAATILEVWQAVGAEIASLDERQKNLLQGLIDSDDIQNLESELHDELGDIFEQIGDVYGVANTFRKNYFIALLANLSTVDDAINVARESAGYSAKENNEYLESYTAKLNKLQSQWQKLANDEQGWLKFRKGLLDVGRAMLTLIEYTGGLRTTFIALGTVIATVFGAKVVSAIKNFFATIAAGNATINATAGIIGIIATAISIVVGLVEKLISDAEEARKQAIDLYNQNKENNIELAAYYEHLKSLKKGSAEYYETEKKIVELLGDKKTVLSGLTAGTEEYSAALANLTNIELTSALIAQEKAQKAAAEKLLNINRTSSPRGELYLYDSEAEKNALRYYTDIPVQTITGNARGYSYQKTIADWGMRKTNSVEDAIYNYNRAREIADMLASGINQARIEGDERGATALKNLFTEFDVYISAVKEYIETYNDSSTYLEQIQKRIEALGKEEEKTAEETAKDLSDIGKKWADIVSKLKEANNEYKEQEKLAEKLQSIEDARADAAEKQLEAEKKLKELRDAENERNVRVLNWETGAWEWQANAKTVDAARTAYEKAVEDANKASAKIDEQSKAYDDMLYDKAEKAIYSLENPSNADVLNILNDALAQNPDSEYLRERLMLLLGRLNKISGVRIGGYYAGNFVAAGTPNLLGVTSNEQFQTQAASENLLFGSGKSTASAETVKGSSLITDNSNSNNIYINGMTISREVAENY